ncbi:MAG TPA: GDSL-type esterase/lipase family protein, partial [Ktedonobacteraceae bacterium]|nr:GDSL-type esterase/lipase family protein [Ktedonobacteraceae bacterium]
LFARNETNFMKIHLHLKYWHLFLLLALTMLCVACASSTGAQGTAPTVKATPTPSQPISAQQVLTSPITYVALGASDAVGVGANQPASQGYVPLLTRKLPQGSHLINLGVSGIHLHDALNEELPLALSTSPQLITIWLVANDFVANVPYTSYMQDLNTLLSRLRAGTQARIAMANLPNLTLLPSFARLDARQKAAMVSSIKHWNTGIASMAARYHVTLVDLQTQNSLLTAHPEYISSDGFHPSSAGYVQLANLFWQAIKA